MQNSSYKQNQLLNVVIRHTIKSPYMEKRKVKLINLNL